MLRTLKLLLASATLMLVIPDPADAQRARGGAHQSVNRGGAHNMNRDANVNRNVNRNTNVNRNINVNRDIDIDVDHGWDHDYHPIATGIAVGTAAAVTSAVIGSILYSPPPACPPYPYGGYTYYYCNNVWYEPRYAGSSVTYVVINDPR